FFFFQAEDGIRYFHVTGVQTCALPILLLQALSAYTRTDTIAGVLSAFAYMAIASSFLGVTLGLFDYIRDVFNFPDTANGRFKTRSEERRVGKESIDLRS